MMLSLKLVTMWTFPAAFLFLREPGGKKKEFLSDENGVHPPVSLYLEEGNSCSPQPGQAAKHAIAVPMSPVCTDAVWMPSPHAAKLLGAVLVTAALVRVIQRTWVGKSGNDLPAEWVWS